MQWRSSDEIAVMALLPEGYRDTMLAHTEITALIEGIGRWHPE